MFEDPELQDSFALSLNENYDDQNLSCHDRRKAPTSSDYGCEAPGIQVIIKEEEEEDGWTVSDNYASYCSGRETENTWHPHFRACGTESSDSYRVKGQQRLNLVEKCSEEAGSYALCGPSSSARKGQQRHVLFDSDAKSEMSCAYGTALRHMSVNECNNAGEESFSCPVREMTSSHRRNMSFHRRRPADDGCYAPDQSRDVNQSTSLTTEAELHETKISSLCQADSPERNSPVTQEIKMASSNMEGQTLRLTVRLQAGEAEEEEDEQDEQDEQDEEIGGFINSDGEVVDWDASPDQGSDHTESPHQSKDVSLSESRLQGHNHRFSSSPTLIMEVVGDEDEREEEEGRERLVKMATISPLNYVSAGKKRRRKNKVAEKTVAPLNVSDAEKQAPANPVKRRSRRKITEIPPLYADLDSEPEMSRRTKRRKHVPAIVDSEESNSKTVQRVTAKQKKGRKKKEAKQSAEGGEKSGVSVGKKLPGRKRLRFPVEIPPELLKKPKEKIEYQCSVCGKEFPHAYKLERHELIHTGEKPYCCSICGRGFNQKGNLKTHYKVHFGQKGVADFEEEMNPDASELSEYLKSLPGESKIRSSLHCLECGKDCESQSALQAHHITAHSQTPVESDTVEHNTPQSLLCSRCGIQFTKKEKLEEHMKTHMKEKRFACPDCGKKFINESYIQIHQRIHTGERPYLCSQCGRGFHTSSSLKLHEMQHSEERPFACSICGKTFRMNSYLMAHYQTHIIDRPFICSVCGKGYSRIEELKVHHRLHTGERPYECGECGKSFIYRQGLRQHQRTHAGRRMGPTRQLGRPKQQARPDI